MEKAERGERSAGKLAVLDEICQVLRIDLSTLIGKEPSRPVGAGVDDGAAGRIRVALERYALGDFGDGAPPDLAVLRRRLTHAWVAFEFSGYSVLASALPGLLEDAERARATLAGGEPDVMLAEVYQIISSVLRKLGDPALAWLAADRGVAASERAGDWPAAAGAGFRAANALLSMGRASQALALHLSLASRLEADARAEDMRALRGQIMLQAAVAAAAAGDDKQAADLIGEARAAAASLTPGIDYFRLAFGPLNVVLHQVAVLVAVGDNERAVQTADTIGGEELRMLRKERRATLPVGTARACGQAGRREEALARLLDAEEIAPLEVRSRPLTQALIAGLLHRCRGAGPPALTGLARRAGVWS